MRQSALIALLAAGCAARPAELRSPGEDLRFCAFVVNSGRSDAVEQFKSRNESFERLEELESPDDASSCDVIARLTWEGSRTYMGSGFAEVVAARTGELLLRTETYNSWWGRSAMSKAAEAVAEALRPGTAPYAKALAARGAPVAMAPAPGPASAGSSPSAASARAAAPAPAGGPVREIGEGTSLAVLELRNKLGARKGEVDVGYFTDRVRTAALRAAPGLHVFTRENLLVLLGASGLKLEECEGECEVETGRRVGADLVVSGEALLVGRGLRLSLKLHDARSGRLLSGAVAAGAAPDELEASTGKAVEELMAPLARPAPAPASAPAEHEPRPRPPVEAGRPLGK